MMSEIDKNYKLENDSTVDDDGFMLTVFSLYKLSASKIKIGEIEKRKYGYVAKIENDKKCVFSKIVYSGIDLESAIHSLKATRSYIYLIQNQQTGNVKIGYSCDVDKRFRVLQAHNDCQLILLGCISGTIGDEKKMHKQFEKYRINNEWFKFDQSIANAFNLSGKF